MVSTYTVNKENPAGVFPMTKLCGTVVQWYTGNKDCNWNTESPGHDLER